jgi:hypothetical protein
MVKVTGPAAAGLRSAAMPQATRGPSRSTALVWAAIGEVVLGGLVLALLTTFDPDDGVPFGVPGAAAVMGAAMAATAVGAMLAAAKPGTGPRRAVALAIALLVAVAGGLVAALTIACLFSPNGSVAGLGIPLVLAAVGMNVVAARVAATRRRGMS